jgi:uncharacterized membrane protein YvbJ
MRSLPAIAKKLEVCDMFCPHCGNQVIDSAVICPKCGSALSSRQITPEEDKAGAGWIILAIFLPVVGLILGIIWGQHHESKGKGKTMLTVSIIFFVLQTLFWIAVLASSDDSSYYSCLAQPSLWC